mmetsp:Transcript_14143/g.45117  ORF Transcript_14143/g.45117 Transcript_14143/m.45117 type:complete len:227 (-) Transcript_14143:2121-2801(-)
MSLSLSTPQPTVGIERMEKPSYATLTVLATWSCLRLRCMPASSSSAAGRCPLSVCAAPQSSTSSTAAMSSSTAARCTASSSWNGLSSRSDTASSPSDRSAMLRSGRLPPFIDADADFGGTATISPKVGSAAAAAEEAAKAARGDGTPAPWLLGGEEKVPLSLLRDLWTLVMLSLLTRAYRSASSGSSPAAAAAAVAAAAMVSSQSDSEDSPGGGGDPLPTSGAQPM